MLKGLEASVLLDWYLNQWVGKALTLSRGQCFAGVEKLNQWVEKLNQWVGKALALSSLLSWSTR